MTKGGDNGEIQEPPVARRPRRDVKTAQGAVCRGAGGGEESVAGATVDALFLHIEERVDPRWRRVNEVGVFPRTALRAARVSVRQHQVRPSIFTDEEPELALPLPELPI